MTPHKNENDTEIVRRIISTNISVSENRLDQCLYFQCTKLYVPPRKLHNQTDVKVDPAPKFYVPYCTVS